MSYGVIHHFPGGTKANYEASIAAVHPGPGKLPAGQIFHTSGASSGGWTIVAVHEFETKLGTLSGRHPYAEDAERH